MHLFIYKIVEAEMKCQSLVSLEIFQGSLQERADSHAAAAAAHFRAALCSGDKEEFNNKTERLFLFTGFLIRHQVQRFIRTI